MALKMALSAVGRDCPGIVSEVSSVLFEHGCNIEDSSMTILRGEFAMILIVSVPEASRVEPMERELQQVAQNLRLVLSFRELPEGSDVAVRAPGTPYMVSVYGADRTGIVHQVTKLLADHRVNITDVNTRVVGGKAPVYIMLLEVEVPEGEAGPSMEKQLAQLADRLAVDITVRPLETATL